jgi:hypothetical protein
MILLDEGIEPIQIRLNTILGKLICTSVGAKSKSEMIGEPYEDKITVILPKSISDYSVNRIKLSAINRTVYLQFKDRMFTFIQAQTLAGFSVEQAIRNFVKYYGISNDLYCQDTIRREWNRHLLKAREKQKNKH